MNVPIIKLPSWMWLGSAEGFATPFFICVKYRTRPLIAHEMCHVKQWWKYAIVGFVVLYAFYLLRDGYWDNPFEVEARQAGKEAS